ncbi:hypothetical protein TWF696_000838 [Orbilia brochopaga]|uniref:Uncharacterized protein n=1 Tax=Orbilia brochopaga TaxID=3140254 RepID=A0AAV9VEW8_9PEZI
MADLNELLDVIRDECALTVTQGLPVASIWKLITDCLESDKTAIVPLETLDSTVSTPQTAYYPALPLDSSLRNDIWELIKKDKDISIGIGNEGQDLSFDDAEAGLHAEDQPREDDGPPEWRLYASESLQWRRIAGHDIDTVRLFPTLWQLLKIIAVNREDGILQPHLTAQSGQDARSVGPRTKDLAGKGYIMKIPVIAMKVGTSKLILKRFYKGALEKRKTQKKKRLATIKEHARSGKKLPKEFLEEPLDIEEVIAGIFKLLKAAKNKVLLIEDLKFRLNCTSTRSRRKACRRIMERLESMGCIQKIRAMGSENQHAKEFEMGPVDEERITDLKGARFAKCVKFIRDLKPLEWHDAVKGVRPSVDDKELDALDEFDSDDEQDDGYRVIRSAPTVRVIDGRRVIVPLWRKSHLMHTIYDQILAAGIEGIRSGMLSGAVFGPFYYRPFDQIMGRWTTKSLQNQPDHLKSTSIVRETDLYKRTANYRYWTTENFQAMLDEKQIDYEAAAAAADAYKISKRPKKNKKNADAVDGDEPAVLDENGFSKINPAAFVRGDGRGSFQDCQRAAPKKGSGLRPKGLSPLKGRRLKLEPVRRVEHAPGKGKIAGTGQELQTDELAADDSPREESVIVIGRKRKYPPGTEPYLKEKPRVEAVKKALRLGSIKEVASDGTSLGRGEVPEGFQPLSSIDETTWTIEMIAERTFMDLVENKPYQVPLTTARYRSSGGKKGRPRKTEQAPDPEAIVLGPIFQPGPDGLVQVTPAPEPSSSSKKTAKRPAKRRKTEHSSTAGAVLGLEPPTIVEEAQPMVVDGSAAAEPEHTPDMKSNRAAAANNKQGADVEGEPGVSTAQGPLKRKSQAKRSTPKGRPVKKSKKEAQDQSEPVVEEALVIGQMDIDRPTDPAQKEDIHSTPPKKTHDGDYFEAIPDPKPTVEKSTKQLTETTTSSEGISKVYTITPSRSLEEATDTDAAVLPPTKANEVIKPQPISHHENEISTVNSTNISNKDADAIDPAVSVIADAPAPPPAPKLEPFTDANGIRLELVYAEARKNRSIGGVLKANRRRLLLGMLARSDGAVSINAAYRNFAQYIKEQKEQTSTIDRKTFNGILDDANADGKIFVIGVFKGARRIGTILCLPHLTFQAEQVETAKRVIVDELDKPFAWKMNVSRGIAAKSAGIPIERIDFERYSRASKVPPLGNKGNARRRMDAEKMSTLARLQAITENEKREETAARKNGKGKARADPITSRTRSKTKTWDLRDGENDEPMGGAGQRALSEDSIGMDIPEDTLHRWQVTPVDPNLYPLGTTNFPPYTMPETGNLGDVPYGAYEDYAAASAARNEIGAGFGVLGPESYEPIRPRRRQQAGGRAGRPRTTTVLDGDIDPNLEPTKKRGKQPKEPKPPKQPKQPKEKKPPKPKAPPRPKDAPRLRTTLEEDVTLTLGVIIIRTLFGGYVRSIKWDLVATALPQYDRWSIQAHWPRVRVKMKDEIPQYQAEFEEQYLRAFYQGKVPLFDKNRGCDFDLPWHINWLRPLVKNIRPVTERRILPSDRQQLESLYDIVVTPLDWRRDYFNYMTTMSWKEQQLNHHSSAVVKIEETDELIAPSKRRAIDRAKHVWRSIFVTEDERYDEPKARELMKLHSHQASSAALSELHKVDKFIIRSKKGGRFGTASAQARVLQPWRTAFTADIFPEASDFHGDMANTLSGGGEFKIVSTVLKPGDMAWIIDRLVRGEIDIYTKNFKESNRGLAESLVTRAINPVLFHFDIFVSSSGAGSISRPTLDPAGLLDAVPLGSMTDMALPPFMWQNMYEEVIVYMWERVVRGVLAVVIGKPGATVEIIVKTLNGVLNARDAMGAIRWLLHRGGLVEKSEGRYWGGREYLACGV